MIRIIPFIISVFFLSNINAQTEKVSLLNDIITLLIGKHDNSDIPVFENIEEVCGSAYVSCNSKKQIIGLDFQFASLNGRIPQEITKLEHLNWINLEYNYLSGTIPEGFEDMKNLEQLLLNGNFLKGPIPKGMEKIDRNTIVDLSQNLIEHPKTKQVKRFNITDQVNLQGCRSPDSIYISKKLNSRQLNSLKEISVDPDSIAAKIDSMELVNQKYQDNESSPINAKVDSLESKTPISRDTTSVSSIDDNPDSLKVVETMPRFPGCELEELDEKERDKCAKEKMLMFIYKNLKYPAYGRMHKIEGMVVIQFKVLTDGNIGDVVLLRDPGGRLGNSGQWIVNRMNYICKKWTPGMQRGRPVKVLYTLPIKFKLQC